MKRSITVGADLSRWTSFKVWDRTVPANPHDTVANDLGTDGLFCQTRPRTCRHDYRRLNFRCKSFDSPVKRKLSDAPSYHPISYMSNCVPIVTAANGPISGAKNWSIAGAAMHRTKERPGKVVVIWLKQLELSQGWSVMQIMPSGAAWTNPAALSQQASADTKHVAARNSEATSTEPVTPLEESGKTTDRDANERYDGPQHSAGKIGSATKESEPGTESMMSLPANDDLDASTLDLLS